MGARLRGSSAGGGEGDRPAGRPPTLLGRDPAPSTPAIYIFSTSPPACFCRAGPGRGRRQRGGRWMSALQRPASWGGWRWANSVRCATCSRRCKPTTHLPLAKGCPACFRGSAGAQAGACRRWMEACQAHWLQKKGRGRVRFWGTFRTWGAKQAQRAAGEGPPSARALPRQSQPWRPLTPFPKFNFLFLHHPEGAKEHIIL